MKKAYRPLIISVVLASSIYLGSKLIPSDNNVMFSQKGLTGIHKLNEILNYIEESYVDTISKDKLIEDGIQSLLSDLDPHSYYIPKSQYKDMNEDLEGNFEGIGIEFRIIQDTVMVIKVVPGGPSEKAGLKSGDRLILVNDSLVAGTGIKNASIMKMLKGRQYTAVRVTIKRKKEPKNTVFEITRDRIPITSVQSQYMINSKIGYIKITRFSKTTYGEFKQAADNLVNRGMSALILDLRDNPGGLLNESIEIANEFLKKDKLIVYTEGKARPKKIYYADQDGSLLNVKLVVLLDEGSASASEVLAGAIQDNDRGTIIGRRSFGKGLVQEQVDWPDGSALRLTVARYYTPTGRSIQKPYKNVENYHLETLERIENGELDNQDSIHVVDSLKFYTPEGRVVYGGGGIVPDVFIPIDTLNYNKFYNDLYRKQAIPNFSFHFIDNRRTSLIAKYPGWRSFNEKFHITDADYQKFLEYAAESGVERNPKQAALLKEKVRNDLKSQCARHLYGDEGYYPIVNQSDKALLESLQYLK